MTRNGLSAKKEMNKQLVHSGPCHRWARLQQRAGVQIQAPAKAESWNRKQLHSKYQLFVCRRRRFFIWRGPLPTKIAICV